MLTPQAPVVDLAQAPGSTRWENPTGDTVKFEIRKGPDDAFTNSEGKVIRVVSNKFPVVIPPAGQVLLPSEYDSAIQRLDETGTQIIGGLAPQLRKVGGPELSVHDALDTRLQEKKRAEAQALLALQSKDAAEAALAKAGSAIVGAGGLPGLPAAPVPNAEVEALKVQLAAAEKAKLDAEQAAKEADASAKKAKAEAKKQVEAAEKLVDEAAKVSSEAAVGGTGGSSGEGKSGKGDGKVAAPSGGAKGGS